MREAGDRAVDLRHRPRQRALEDYFDSRFELEARAARRGKSLEPRSLHIGFARSSGPPAASNRASAMRWCAPPIVGDEPFGCLLPTI